MRSAASSTDETGKPFTIFDLIGDSAHVPERIRSPTRTRSPGARAAISFMSNVDLASTMKRPKIDEKLTLLADFGKTEAICAEVLDNPATEEGVLLKVRARGPFQEGQQVWIV